MRNELHMALNEDTYREAWPLYLAAMQEVQPHTWQSHVAPEETFKDWMCDLALEKRVVRDDAGAMIGLGVITNQLAAWPLISEARVQATWPELYRWGRVWVVGFAVVAPGARGSGAFRELLLEMTNGRTAEGQQFVMDFCDYNLEQRHIIAGVLTTLRRGGLAPRAQLLGRQEYWSITFAE